MSCFAVMREAGPGWADGKGAFEQPEVAEHSAYMAELAGQGFLLLAGPLAGTEQGRIRVLLVVDAADEGEVHRRLADDPWSVAKRVVIGSVEPWNLLVGAERVAQAAG
jgi:uncharacterized protein YciI